MKIGRNFVLAGIALAVCASPAFAQTPRLAFSFQGGGAGHEENNLNVGLAAGFALAVPLTQRLSLVAEIDHWRTGSRTSYRKLYAGRLSLTPFLVGLRYDFPGNGYFSPYVLAGAGYVESEFRIGSSTVVPDVTTRQDVRSGATAFIGFGALWKLSGYWDFFTEMNYLIRTAPARTITTDAAQNVAVDRIWINLHVVYWKFGLRFLF
jgi:opacity protein-like surface antigen